MDRHPNGAMIRSFALMHPGIFPSRQTAIDVAILCIPNKHFVETKLAYGPQPWISFKIRANNSDSLNSFTMRATSAN